MDEYNKSLIKRWHDSRVFNLEKDRFKQKRIISTEITPIDSYSMTSKSLYPYLLADTFNRYFKMCGENIYYIIGIDTASYVSYSFLSNHYLDSKNMLKEYLDVLNIMGVGFDYESIITQENDFVLKEIDKIFLSLYNKDIFFENGPVLTDSLGIKIYNYFEARENNGAFYDAKTDALLCKTNDDYFYFEMRPYIKELETLIDGLSLSAEKKDKIYKRLGKKRCVKFLFSNYKEKIEIKVNLPKTYWLGGVVAILLNPKYMDVMPYVCSTEYEVVNHYLQNGYQAGVFSGTTVLNPLTGEEVLLFISYDTECDIYPLIPACRKFDKIYTDSFGLDVKEITENDLMINSDFLNGLDINEASRALEENFVFEGMAFIEYQYESTKLIISKKEGYGILIPMMLKNEREIVPSNLKYLPFYYNQRMRPVINNEAELESEYEISGFEMTEELVYSLMRYLEGRIDTNLNVEISKPDAKELSFINEDKIIEELIIPHLIKLALNESPKVEYSLYKLNPVSEQALLAYNTQNINFTRDILRESKEDAYRLYILSAEPCDDFEMTKLHIAKYEQFIDELESLYHDGFSENTFCFEERLYKLTGELNSLLKNKRLDLYIESINRFLFEELLTNKMSEREALIYLKLVSIVCPFTSQKLFEEIFEENYFLVYEEWPFLN